MKPSALIALLLCFALCLPACAEEDNVVALVNGEALTYAEYAEFETSYLLQFQSYGYDLSDESSIAYVQDLALTAAIEFMLTQQDMRALGFYDFDEETDAWLTEQGNAAYQAALQDVGEMLQADVGFDDSEMEIFALAYASELGVTAESYIDLYRNQYATANYYDWLTRDQPVTEADVQAEYDARVAASQALYENDIPAFETALYGGSEVWYSPAGYRSILQILLPATGETDEEKLASVQSALDAINQRLADGETFQALIAEYGTDANFSDESFYAVGYQVHPNSILWEDAFIAAAFSAEMAQPGDHSLPFASSLGVHILYYLADVPGGPVALSQDVYNALAYTIYSARCQTLLAQRIDQLAAEAEVITY